MGVFFGIFAASLLAGVPIALALGLGAAIYLWSTGDVNQFLAFPQRMIAGVDQFVLLTIPLFVLAGALMNVGGLTTRIIEFARVFVGHRRGGLSSVTVISSGLFAGISGSAPAEASALGSILIPAMSRQGIPSSYAAALVGVSAVLGPIIPPSITMIIFGVLAGASIGQLLLAGVIPGLLLVAGLLIYANWNAKRLNLPVTPQADWREKHEATVRTTPALILPLIIIVGIKFGIFTATEAAAVAVIYAIIVGFLYRDLTVKAVWDAMVSTAIVSSAIMFIVAMANIVAFVLTLEQVPTQISQGILSISDNPYVILLLINLVLLVLGMFLEPISILILTMPVLLAIQKVIEMDIIQFGMMVVLNVVIGMATPPVGICLFIVCAISGRPLSEVSWRALPLLAVCFIVLAIVALVPQVSLFLPRAFGAVE
jgi:tripartite ATP-independent transporter DctM subunit